MSDDVFGEKIATELQVNEVATADYGGLYRGYQHIKKIFFFEKSQIDLPRGKLYFELICLYERA